MSLPIRINVGCGATPTPGWVNFDNSLTVRLARFPLLISMLQRAGVMSEDQVRFAGVARERGIAWADAARRLPFSDSQVSVVYSCHMLEHLEPADARVFLREVWRVLAPDGHVRIAVPDLSLLAAAYKESGNANAFVDGTLLATPRAHGLAARLRWLANGHRGHAWMYDGPSLVVLLGEAGFAEAKVVPAGESRIPDPGELNLREREDESVYVEARKIGDRT